MADPWRRKEVIGDCTLYLGDCLEVMPTLGNVDAVVTSPPYAQQRDYGQKITDWRGLVSGALTRVSDNAQILCNLGLIYRDGECVQYWDDLISDMRGFGWRLFGWYVWDQGDGLPGNWNGRLAPSHEWIFHFNKRNGLVNKWVRPKKIRQATGTGLRRADGSTSGISSPHLCGQAEKIQDSVLRVYRQMARDVNHPAVFPVTLPAELLQSFSNRCETVLDPFMGSGTTGVACVKLGRKFIGIEIDDGYFDIACKRIREAYAQPDMFIEAPKQPAPVQETLLLEGDT